MKTNFTTAWMRRAVLGYLLVVQTVGVQAQAFDKVAAAGRKLHQAPKEKTSALESALSASMASNQASTLTFAQQQERFQQADQEYLKLSRQINPGADPMASNLLIGELEAAFAADPSSNGTNDEANPAGWIVQTNAQAWQLYAQPMANVQGYWLEKSTDGRRFQRTKEKLRLTGNYWQAMLSGTDNSARYFRVCAVSASKKQIRSAVMEKRTSETPARTMFVNPLLIEKGILEIQIPALPDGPYRLSITDSRSQEQAYFLINLPAANRRLQFPIAETMAPGLYQVSLSGQSITCTQAFIR